MVRIAEENRDWGYDRIAGALANLGYKVSDQTISAASDWVGCCAITIKRQHNRTPKVERRSLTPPRRWPD